MGTKPNDLRTANSFVPEFEASLPNKRLTILEFATLFSEFFLDQWEFRMPSDYSSAGMTFVFGGFNQDEPYGEVYQFNIPNLPTPKEESANTFGITWGGQPEFVTRLIKGYDPELPKIVKRKLALSDAQIAELTVALLPLNMGIPYAVLSLQDCIDLAVFLVKTTIGGQSLSMRLRGVGGAIDVSAIQSRDGIRIVQEKKLVGEKSTKE